MKWSAFETKANSVHQSWAEAWTKQWYHCIYHLRHTKTGHCYQPHSPAHPLYSPHLLHRFFTWSSSLGSTVVPKPPNGITSTAVTDFAERFITFSDFALDAFLLSGLALGIIKFSDLAFLPGKLPHVSILAGIIQIKGVKMSLGHHLALTLFLGFPASGWPATKICFTRRTIHIGAIMCLKGS